MRLGLGWLGCVFCLDLQEITLNPSYNIVSLTSIFDIYNLWCGYQSLFPRLYRLLITIILQDHPGSPRQTLRCFLFVDPRACGCAHNPPRCVSTLTPTSEKEKTCEGTTVPQRHLTKLSPIYICIHTITIYKHYSL